MSRSRSKYPVFPSAIAALAAAQADRQAPGNRELRLELDHLIGDSRGDPAHSPDQALPVARPDETRYLIRVALSEHFMSDVHSHHKVVRVGEHGIVGESD